MLTFPNLPTDSLYKFIFIAGVVLIVVSLYQNPKVQDEYYNKSMRTDSLSFLNKDTLGQVSDTLSLFDNQIKSANNLNHRYNITCDSIINRSKRGIKISNDLIKTYRSQKSNLDSIENILLKSSSKQVNLINKKFKLKVEDVYLKARLVRIEKSYDSQRFQLIAMVLMGFVLMFMGGFGWFIYIQSPQDKLLQIQLKEAEKKATIIGRTHFEPKILPRTKLRGN
jgi:hypothetical protein